MPVRAYAQLLDSVFQSIAGLQLRARPLQTQKLRGHIDAPVQLTFYYARVRGHFGHIQGQDRAARHARQKTRRLYGQTAKQAIVRAREQMVQRGGQKRLAKAPGTGQERVVQRRRQHFLDVGRLVYIHLIAPANGSEIRRAGGDGRQRTSRHKIAIVQLTAHRIKSEAMSRPAVQCILPRWISVAVARLR